jgi:hypothetical protein
MVVPLLVLAVVVMTIVVPFIWREGGCLDRRRTSN